MQKRDQEWTNGNNALLASLQKKTPVRVIRGIANLYPESVSSRQCLLVDCVCGWCSSAEFNAAKHYVYDGLYQVTNAWTDISNKYRECRFQLQGIQGEYRVSGTVEVGSLYKRKPNRMVASLPSDPK